MKKKGMTLIELLIVIVIMGILVGLLFSTYQRINDLRTRISNTATLQTQVLSVSQLMTSLLQNYTIDYAAYSWSLIPTNGITTGLKLILRDGVSDTITGTALVFGSGGCANGGLSGSELRAALRDHPCSLYLQIGDNPASPITDPLQVVTVSYLFKITPVESNDIIFSTGSALTATAATHPGVRLLRDVAHSAYSYSDEWPYKVRLQSQQFFNLP